MQNCLQHIMLWSNKNICAQITRAELLDREPDSTRKPDRNQTDMTKVGFESGYTFLDLSGRFGLGRSGSSQN